MTYRSPGITIEQILLRMSQPLAESELLPCFVGPINQVVEKEPLAGLTLPVVVATNAVAYTNLKVGAIVYKDTVKFHVKSASVRVRAATLAAGVFVAGSSEITIPSAYDKIKVGDTISLTISGGGSYTVTKDYGVGRFGLSYPINFAPATGDLTTSYVVDRYVGDIEAILDGNAITESTWSFSGLNFKIGESAFPIVSGAPCISYVALRKDLTGTYEVTDLSTLMADMSVDIANPLGFILGQCMPMASGGRRALAYILPDNLDTSYSVAMEKIGSRNDAYLISTTSTSFAVQQIIASHAVNMSTKDNSMFRAALTTTHLPESVDLVTAASFVKK